MVDKQIAASDWRNILSLCYRYLSAVRLKEEVYGVNKEKIVYPWGTVKNHQEICYTSLFSFNIEN